MKNDLEKGQQPQFCQSCGMPLSNDILGTNADGSKSFDYCIYCYKDGAFTGDFTMEEMAEYCSMFVDEYNQNTGKNLTIRFRKRMADATASLAVKLIYSSANMAKMVKMRKSLF